MEKKRYRMNTMEKNRSYIYVKEAKSIKNLYESDILAFRYEIENMASIFLDDIEKEPHSYKEVFELANRDELTFYWYLRGKRIAQQMQSVMNMYSLNWKHLPARFLNTLALMQNAMRSKLKNDKVEHKIIYKIVSDNIFIFIDTYKMLVLYKELLHAYKDVFGIKYLDGLVEPLNTTIEQLKDKFKEYNETVERFYLGVFPRVEIRKDMYKKDQDQIRKDFIEDVNVASSNYFNLLAEYGNKVNIKMLPLDKIEKSGRLG